MTLKNSSAKIVPIQKEYLRHNFYLKRESRQGSGADR